MSESVDVLIVGSGPVGSAFANQVLAHVPDAAVLVVDAGPRLTEAPGENIRNVPEPRRAALQEQVSGPPSTVPVHSGVRPTAARPGTTLLRPDDGAGDGQAGLPAAALSTNIGGMGAHWTCAVPLPGGSERIDFLGERLDDALHIAGELLSSTTSGFRSTPAGEAVLAALRRKFDGVLPVGREPGPMPLACTPAQPLPRWSGADTVLGDAREKVEIRSDTIARRVLVDGDRATGALLEDTITHRSYTVAAKVVVVAADAFRTPQLLWASGIRPQALGRYLNDQPQVVSGARVNVPSVGEGTSTEVADIRDSLTGVCWVPFADDVHPFHGQVMQLDASPFAVAGDGGDGDDRPFVALGWFCAKDIRAQDRVWFDDAERDRYDLPAIRIDYDLSETDRQTIDRASKEVVEVAAALGEIIRDPVLLPSGFSLHYQGTVRMGQSDDGTSVCDTDSRVWGTSNLFVGGNGVIPTATACNPTLTSVALAVLAARAVADLLV
ncbi:MAG: GMC family oxidoreductase [Gordonia sp. (in: high G+C Gram-positive bacteria)]